MRMRAATLVLIGAALAQKPGHAPCVHGKPGALAWTEDAALRDATLAQLPKRTTPKRHTLNLDLPAEQRWDEICKLYRPQAHIIHDYLKNQLGKLAGAMGCDHACSFSRTNTIEIYYLAIVTNISLHPGGLRRAPSHARYA